MIVFTMCSSDIICPSCPLVQWNTVDETEQASLQASRVPIQGTQVTLTAMQIRTFIVNVQ